MINTFKLKFSDLKVQEICHHLLISNIKLFIQSTKSICSRTIHILIALSIVFIFYKISTVYFFKIVKVNFFFRIKFGWKYVSFKRISFRIFYNLVSYINFSFISLILVNNIKSSVNTKKDTCLKSGKNYNYFQSRNLPN